MTQSPRIGAPFLEPAQVDKSTTHNEALSILDIAVSAAVDGFLLNAPPASPAAGDCYIVGNDPTGAWAGHALALAGYTAGGWRFVAPFAGLAVRDTASGQVAVFTTGAWELGHVQATTLSVAGDQVVGPRLPAVVDPSGGSTVDAEARTAISAILTRLRQHGLIAS